MVTGTSLWASSGISLPATPQPMALAQCPAPPNPRLSSKLYPDRWLLCSGLGLWGKTRCVPRSTEDSARAVSLSAPPHCMGPGPCLGVGTVLLESGGLGLSTWPLSYCTPVAEELEKSLEVRAPAPSLPWDVFCQGSEGTRGLSEKLSVGIWATCR